MRHVVYDLSQGATYVCWGVVGLVWATSAIVARGATAPGETRDRDLASLAGIALGVAAVLTPASLWRPLSTAAPALRLAGMVVLAAGTGATLWARMALGALWSSAPATRQGLRTDGLYRFTRHPIYGGILVMLAGTALTQGLGRWVALVLAVAVVLVVKLRQEERLLGRQFPAEYERYRRRVPALVPRISALTIRARGSSAPDPPDRSAPRSPRARWRRGQSST